jgi:plasmid maintenance system killer protein
LHHRSYEKKEKEKEKEKSININENHKLFCHFTKLDIDFVPC